MKNAMRTLTLVLALALAGGALADVSNGDFEAGDTDWTYFAPSDWTIGVQAGGNPGMHGYIMSPFGDSGGIACFEQGFWCGEDDPTSLCMINLDFYLHIIDATPGTARVVVSIDGIVQFVSPPGVDHIDWTRITLEVPCGYHVISLCLEVDPGNNGWEAGFDNVIAECEGDTPAGENSWSTVKSLY